nr:EsaB/YukD family protein [uncultured Actinotalea sp.]
MSRFTRLTFVGAERRAEVVVPSDERLATMLPQLLELLGERTTTTPQAVELVRVTGEPLDLARDCAEQGVPDGEVLRVVRAAHAPPPPQVADVTDAAAEALGARADRWDVTARQRLAAVAVGVLAAVAGAALALLTPDLAPVVLGVVALTLAVAAAVDGRGRRRYPWLVLTAAALGPAVPMALALTIGGAGLPVGARLGLLLAWVVLTVAVGVGRRDRGALAGGALGLVLTGGHLLLGLGLPTVTADALVVVLAVVVVGLLPWYAMVTAGLTGLDDAVLDGAELPARDRVHATLDHAYGALTWSTLAVVVALAPSAAGLLLVDDLGAVWLGVVALVVVALRTRSLPLRRQVVLLWAAVGVPVLAVAVALLLAASGAFGDLVAPVADGPLLDVGTPLLAATALGAALLVAIAAGLQPSGQQRARLRRLGDRLELLAVLALLPLLLGVLGVYGDLLGTFG